MSQIVEIAPDVYRLCLFHSELNLQFNHFLIKDDEPLLFHAGYKASFPELRALVEKIIPPAHLRWISFSHFESDECGALNYWLDAAPHASAACNFLGAALNINDFASRPPRVLQPEESLTTGKHQYRFCSTAHVPHGWDAGVLFDETTGTLFCSDLLFHPGNVEPVTSSDIVGRSRQALLGFKQSPFAYSAPYTPQTDEVMERLAALRPKLLATMHGSSFSGDGASALRGFATVIRETSERPQSR
jgi:flavorubredoxin